MKMTAMMLSVILPLRERALTAYEIHDGKRARLVGGGGWGENLGTVVHGSPWALLGQWVAVGARAMRSSRRHHSVGVRVGDGAWRRASDQSSPKQATHGLDVADRPEEQVLVPMSVGRSILRNGLGHDAVIVRRT